MTVLPLSAPKSPMLNPGDIVQIDSFFSRPPSKSKAWWAMLIFGPAFACRHLGWAFRRKPTSPFYQIPTSRRGLFDKRELQRFVITGHAESTQ